MHIDDRTTLGIGIGYILGKLKFNTYVSKDSQAKVGYRVRRSIAWSNGEPAIHMTGYLQSVLDIGGLDYSSAWESKEHLDRFRLLIDRLDREYKIVNAFSDAVGFHMFMWTYDNPPPSDYELFASWAKEYDYEHHSIKEEESMN